MKYYAVVHEDGSGCAFGTGTSIGQAMEDAIEYLAGGDSRKESGQYAHLLTGLITIEITAQSYRKIMRGDPDAVYETEESFATRR